VELKEKGPWQKRIRIISQHTGKNARMSLRMENMSCPTWERLLNVQREKEISLGKSEGGLWGEIAAGPQKFKWARRVDACVVSAQRKESVPENRV